MKDTYSNFDDLARDNAHGRDYRITLLDRNAATTIIAPHAGGIEPGASEIAVAIAGDDLNCYLFEGLRVDSNTDLHLTSTRFDEPRCLNLLRRSSKVVSVHGCVGDKRQVWVGGLNTGMRDRMIDLLRQDGFWAEKGQRELAGNLATNLCNMGRTGKGIQLEFSTGLRRLLFRDLDNRLGRKALMPLFHTLVTSIRTAIAWS